MRKICSIHEKGCTLTNAGLKIGNGIVTYIIGGAEASDISVTSRPPTALELKRDIKQKLNASIPKEDYYGHIK